MNRWKIKKFEDLTTIELYEILKVRAEAFIVGQECIYQDIDDKDKRGWHLFLENNEGIVACLRILEKGVSYDEISIGRVATLPGYRRKGYANEMLDRALEFVEKELKERTVRIFAQKYLIEFYGRKGFVQVSDVHYNNGKELVEMLREV